MPGTSDIQRSISHCTPTSVSQSNGASLHLICWSCHCWVQRGTWKRSHYPARLSRVEEITQLELLLITFKFMRSEVIMVVNEGTMVFRDVTPCSSVHRSSNIYAAGFSEVMVPMYRTTRHHIPKDYNLSFKFSFDLFNALIILNDHSTWVDLQHINQLEFCGSPQGIANSRLWTRARACRYSRIHASTCFYISPLNIETSDHFDVFRINLSNELFFL
jgi:hypothetical protein